jgi:ubiquinone/menaquinone biosynthesis C-methylase UbiE
LVWNLPGFFCGCDEFMESRVMSFEEPVRDPEGVEVAYLKGLDGIEGRRVLEIGCGNGRLLRRYAGFAAGVTGVDPDAGRLADALEVRPEFENKVIDFVQSHAERLPFANGAFESVLLGWSL